MRKRKYITHLFLLMLLAFSSVYAMQDEGILKKMRKVEDPAQKLTLYFDKTSPTESNKMAFYLFTGKYGPRSPFIMMRIQDVGEEHLDITGYEFHVDGELFKVLPEREGDIRKGGQPPARVKILDGEKPEEFETLKSMCFEYYERSIRKDQLKMINRIIESDIASIIYIGKKGQKSHIITAGEKAALKNILEVFLFIGGDFEWVRE